MSLFSPALHTLAFLKVIYTPIFAFTFHFYPFAILRAIPRTQFEIFTGRKFTALGSLKVNYYAFEEIVLQLQIFTIFLEEKHALHLVMTYEIVFGQSISVKCHSHSGFSLFYFDFISTLLG
jgi:hypothetical protein